MTSVAVGVLLTIGVASVLLSAAGLLAARDAWDKLNYAGAATIIGPLAIAAAVLVEEPLSAAGVKAVLVAIIMVFTGPVLVHATARAGRIREHGRFVILSKEAERREPPSRPSKR
jgi:multisubunit Na+/H+ antiporter MnhG subunit